MINLFFLLYHPINGIKDIWEVLGWILVESGLKFEKNTNI
jgi:hypothetical protein